MLGSSFAGHNFQKSKYLEPDGSKNTWSLLMRWYSELHTMSTKHPGNGVVVWIWDVLETSTPDFPKSLAPIASRADLVQAPFPPDVHPLHRGLLETGLRQNPSLPRDGKSRTRLWQAGVLDGKCHLESSPCTCVLAVPRGSARPCLSSSVDHRLRSVHPLPEGASSQPSAPAAPYTCAEIKALPPA